VNSIPGFRDPGIPGLIPYPQRVTYKLCLLTYNCLNGLALDCVCRAILYVSHLSRCTFWSKQDVHPAVLHAALGPRSFGIYLAQLPGMQCRSTCGTSTSLWVNSVNLWKLRCYLRQAGFVFIGVCLFISRITQ